MNKNKEANICEIARVYGKLENDGRLEHGTIAYSIKHRRKVYIDIYKSWLVALETKSTSKDITSYAYENILIEYGNSTGGIKLQLVMMDIIDYIQNNKKVDQEYWNLLGKLKKGIQSSSKLKNFDSIYRQALEYTKEEEIDNE